MFSAPFLSFNPKGLFQCPHPLKGELFYPLSAAGKERVVERSKDRVSRLQKRHTEAIIQSPFQGIGKPEALKYALAGKWSRRITDTHRYVYQIENNILKVYSLKGHY
ncbi:MAG TPA: Txe/YoeB family addiction module toxin [Mucilaginibacter sp.]|jgi:Txe/YoeB family toxin of toxin-antitoxin system